MTAHVTPEALMDHGHITTFLPPFRARKAAVAQVSRNKNMAHLIFCTGSGKAVLLDLVSIRLFGSLYYSLCGVTLPTDSPYQPSYPIN